MIIMTVTTGMMMKMKGKMTMRKLHVPCVYAQIRLTYSSNVILMFDMCTAINADPLDCSVVSYRYIINKKDDYI